MFILKSKYQEKKYQEIYTGNNERLTKNCETNIKLNKELYKKLYQESVQALNSKS